MSDTNTSQFYLSWLCALGNEASCIVEGAADAEARYLPKDAFASIWTGRGQAGSGANTIKLQYGPNSHQLDDGSPGLLQ
jgi:hypothetical protein